MKLLSYEEMSVVTVNCTPNPNEVAKLACDHTMYAIVDPSCPTKIGEKLLRFLVTAEHTSILEHCTITFAIRGISRSLLAQVTRQRMSSFTSKSQHYQDHSDCPMVIDTPMLYESLENVVPDTLESCLHAYEFLTDEQVPREEARQILPNAAAVNLLWTINARSLMLFLRQRLCRRNVKEMYIFADKIRMACMLWWPELFKMAGAPCNTPPFSGCNQGHMRSELCK